jgi:hypothetical protein
LAFTPSGTFENGRKAELLTQYSEYVILDLDDLNPVQLEEAKKIVALAPYTFAVFISPSGNGLKIIVAVNSKQSIINCFSASFRLLCTSLAS